MRRIRLNTVLVGSTAFLVLFAVLAIALATLRLLGRWADEQAFARVALAGSAARPAGARSAADVRTAARLLAERPTAARLLAEGDTAALAMFLERFRATSGLSYCAVAADGRVFAAAGSVPSRGDLTFVAREPFAARQGAEAVCALALDERFAARIAGQVGLPVRLSLGGPVEEPEPVRGPVREGERYVAREVVAREGLSVAVETSLPRDAIAASLRTLERRFLLLALAVAMLAILVGGWLGRRISGPIQTLERAALRIGGGDLANPISEIPGPGATPAIPAVPAVLEVAEVGSLAAAMEEMRRRLGALTTELRRRRAETEAVLSGIADGVFSVDRDRRIRYLNPQAAALLGVAPNEALGRFCGDVLDPVGEDGVRPCEANCPIVHARFRGGARATESLRRGDGKLAVVITSAEIAEEQQVQVIRAETGLETSRRLRDAVVANVSHEFKTPLAAQLASLELLAERLDELGDEPARKLAASLERGTLRLTRLIDNLLESVRIEAGEDRIRKSPVALDEVVEQAAELTAPLLERRGQKLSIDLPFPLPRVVGDAERLTQVLVNLLANAQKFAPEGTTITIGGRAEPGKVRLWVDDEGPGLPSGSPDDLFARFVRTPKRHVGRGADGPGAEPTEPEETGMGLGLFIVRSIVERHGGRVMAQPLAKGARFSFTLPALAAEEAA